MYEMSGGITPKRRGKSFEYRVRDCFIDNGWDSIVIPLSGASELISEEMGVLDVRASKGKKTIFCECKKTSKDSLNIKREWLSRLDSKNNEFLVFAMQRTDIYCILPLTMYCDHIKNHFTDLWYYKDLGTTKQHKLSKDIIKDIPTLFMWDELVFIIDSFIDVINVFK